MNYSDIKQVFPSTSSLTLASYFTEDEQAYLSSEVTLSNFPFGKSDKDAIQVTVFAFDGTTITSSYFIPTGEHLEFTKSYYDVFNKFVEYSYTSFQSDLVIVGNETKSVFFDVAKQLNDMGVQEGNYKVGIQLTRDIVGSHSDDSQKLVIDSISPSRTEITVIPVSTRAQDTMVNQEFYAYSSDKVEMKDVVDDTIAGISKPEIYTIFYRVAAQNPDGMKRFLFDYGFRQEVDAINFLTDIYYGVAKGNRRASGQFATVNVLGIYDQFANWAYMNYNGAETFDTIRNQYYSFFRFIVDQELNGINTKKPDDYDQVVDFLSSIYYNSIFFPVISAVEMAYEAYISGYFKNFLDFGTDGLFSVLNTKVIPATTPSQHDRLAIKLDRKLPDNLAKGQLTWIVNTFASAPILQNTYFYLKPVIKLIKLRGPNLLTRIESQGNSTETVSLEELIGETGSLYNEVLSKLEKKNESSNLRTVDYRYFENFVNFSSADLRIQAYGIKANNIAELNAEIADLNAKLILQPTDEFYLKEKEDAQDQIDEIKASFDGYESFLFNNPVWYSEHTNVYGGVSSASLYDSENQNSLINNLPQFMIEDELNNDYIKFVGMIGHFFDNLSVSINQFTEKNNPAAGPNDGISMDVVYSQLLSLGWEAEISKENLPLLLGAFSKADFSVDSPLYNKVGELSENDRNKLIWKRILNTLPFIYKTKGTQASINAIISCFGIPKNLIKIKEYGSIDQSDTADDTGWYIFEETKFSPYFSGSGEYFQIPWTGSANSLEFNVSFDKTRTSAQGEVFRLVSNENNWVLGVHRERGMEWGRVFLSIGDGTGSVTTALTEKVPIFDGNQYTVLFRRNEIGHPSEYPTDYEIVVKKGEAERIVFTATSSVILSGSYNNVFKSGSYLYVGNYQQATASFGIDPEAFWGTLDEIKVWELPLDNNSMTQHTLYRGGYSYTSPVTMVDKLLARVSFNQPIDFFSETGSLGFANTAFRGDFPTLAAVNFPPVSGLSSTYPECNLPDDAPIYPYQFKVETITQATQVASYGSQTMRSNKIAHVDQTLLSFLSSNARATSNAAAENSVDSNKVGVFFSPIDAQNEEILKFFGNYNFGDLIGDPRLAYESSYRQFEKFRLIYYNQGFGIVDYQTFMNVVRAYFDKAMFKYISSVIPARAKLVDGILIEPSILERPKLQLKPVVREEIDERVAALDCKETVQGTSIGVPTASIQIGYRGTSILNDVNHRFYPDLPDQYCLGAYAPNGVYYYNEDYYRVDVATFRKSYQIQRACTLPKSQWNDYERIIDLDGRVQTITRSYKNLNIINLPTLTEFKFTASWEGPGAIPTTAWYFSGSISVPLQGSPQWLTTTVNTAHTIYGITSGSFYGFKDDVTGPEKPLNLGSIINPMLISASFYVISSSVTYVGYFDIISGNYTFEGSVFIDAPGSPSIYSGSQFHAKLISNPTSSIYAELVANTSQLGGTAGLFMNNSQIITRRNKSLEVIPANSEMMVGYFPTHYKYKKQVFSQKEINSFENVYDQNGKATSRPAKWKRGSQNKKTTVDPATGNLNSTEPLERKTV